MAKTIKQNANVVNLQEKTNEVPQIPEETKNVPGLPQETTEVPVSPEAKQIDLEVPDEKKDENCVTISGTKIEIFPTKLKYFRNKTATFYNILKVIPLSEFIGVDKGVFDANRNGDQILFDFLIAVFDDAEFVKNNYDNMTAGDVEKALKIFGRLNGIDEKEEQARKNREAQAKR